MHVIKNITVLFVVLLVAGGALMAQQVGEPDPASIGVDTAQQRLKEVSVSKFEDPGFWRVFMSRDIGLITARRFPGGPLDKEPIPDEEELGIQEADENVLGVKVQFFRRGHHEFFIRPARPLPIEGITKTLSLWVVGRNSPHILKTLVSDQFGNYAEITMGKLNFTGWKKMTAAVPTKIIQRDHHYSNKQGMKIEGFKIECDPVETFGSYYIYFDDLRAVTDLFAEESRDVDDMVDSW